MYQVTAPHFCAGLIVDGEKVVRAAPILGWTVGKSRDELRRYFARKKWSVRYVCRSAPRT